jgi:hypothetical protein
VPQEDSASFPLSLPPFIYHFWRQGWAWVGRGGQANKNQKIILLILLSQNRKFLMCASPQIRKLKINPEIRKQLQNTA